MTFAQLHVAFAAINRKYFDGQLPPYRLQAFRPGTGAYPDGGALAYCDNARQFISFDFKFLTMASYEDVYVTLCHETAHIGQPDDETDHAAYWITSSAVATSVSGMVRPRAFAVLRLMTVSNRVGACTGNSAGFSPLRMRST